MYLSDLKLFTHLQDFHTDFQSKSYIFQHQLYTSTKAKQNITLSRDLVFFFQKDVLIEPWILTQKGLSLSKNLNRHFIRRKEG